MYGVPAYLYFPYVLYVLYVLYVQAGSFSTVEGFWKNYVHLKRPSSIGNNVNVYLFRDAQGHVPMWEVWICIMHLFSDEQGHVPMWEIRLCTLFLSRGDNVPTREVHRNIYAFLETHRDTCQYGNMGGMDMYPFETAQGRIRASVGGVSMYLEPY